MKSRSRIDLELTSSTWEDDDREAIHKVVKSDNLTMGEECKKFEVAFASHFGSKYAVMVNSGSSANLLMVFAMKLRNDHPIGAEIIVPAISWSTTFAPLQQAGYKLKFVDINLESLCIDASQIESAITEATVGIFAVNLLGQMCDFTKISNLAKKYNLIVLEDNCESMGATLEGKHSGTFGSMSSFSTFYSHHISTIEGGVITTNDEIYFHFLLALRAHGWTRNLPEINYFEKKSKDPWVDLFRFVLPGFNVRPMEIQGAIGLTQLKKFDRFLDERRKNAQRFNEYFSEIPGILTQKGPANSSWFGFSIILLNLQKSREKLINLLESQGVQTRPIVSGNFVLNPALKYFNYEIHNNLTNATKVSEHGFFIGNHHFDISSKLERISLVVEEFLNVKK